MLICDTVGFSFQEYHMFTQLYFLDSGQRINMTLLNFARVPLDLTGRSVGDSSSLIPRPRVCYQLALLKVYLYITFL